MSFWTAVVVIFAIAAFAGVMNSRYRVRHGIPLDRGPGRDNPMVNPMARVDEALRREVEELRERVKVLERIATEDRETKRLSAEIESLREK